MLTDDNLIFSSLSKITEELQAETLDYRLARSFLKDYRSNLDLGRDCLVDQGFCQVLVVSLWNSNLVSWRSWSILSQSFDEKIRSYLSRCYIFYILCEMVNFSRLIIFLGYFVMLGIMGWASINRSKDICKFLAQFRFFYDFL